MFRPSPTTLFVVYWEKSYAKGLDIVNSIVMIFDFNFEILNHFTYLPYNSVAIYCRTIRSNHAQIRIANV